MSDIRIKPSSSSLTVMKIASVIVTIVGAGVIVGVTHNGLLEEGGPFVAVWIAACIGIIGLALFMSFNLDGVEEGIVSIEHDGASSTGGVCESVEARLKTLDSLKHTGAISDEEYRTQREKIIQSV